MTNITSDMTPETPTPTGGDMTEIDAFSYGGGVQSVTHLTGQVLDRLADIP